ILIIIILFLVNLHHLVIFALAIFFFSIQFNPLLLGLRSFRILYLIDFVDSFLHQIFMNLFAGYSIHCDKITKWAISYNNPRFDAIQMMGFQAWDSNSRTGKSVYFSETEDDEMDYEAESDFFDDEGEEEENSSL